MGDAKEIGSRSAASAISPRKQPVSAEWQKDCKRNGSGIMAVAFTAGFAWITASHTFIVLSNNRLVHPSSFGWPLYICIFVFILGLYIYIAAEREYFPIPGRKYTPVDQSTRASLWYDTMNVNWSTPYGQGSDKMAASVGVVFCNGNSSTPIVVTMEKLAINVEGIAPASDDASHITFTLLPGKSRTVQSSSAEKVPSGATQGEVYYSATYGPTSRYPLYRRTHKFSFRTSKPITLEAIANGFNGISVTTNDIELQTDTEIS